VKKITANNFLLDKFLCEQVSESRGIVVPFMAQNAHFPGSHCVRSQNCAAQPHEVIQRATR